MDTAFGLFAYIGALSLTAIASALLALFVALRAGALPGSRLLAVFLGGVAAWSIAQALPAIVGPGASPVTTTLVALSPLPAAAFVHLVFAFALCGALRPVVIASYATATFAALVGLVFGVGEVVRRRCEVDPRLKRSAHFYIGYEAATMDAQRRERWLGIQSF